MTWSQGVERELNLHYAPVGSNDIVSGAIWEVLMDQELLVIYIIDLLSQGCRGLTFFGRRDGCGVFLSVSASVDYFRSWNLLPT